MFEYFGSQGKKENINYSFCEQIKGRMYICLGERKYFLVLDFELVKGMGLYFNFVIFSCRYLGLIMLYFIGLLWELNTIIDIK